jgi:hypothetical protein
MVTRGYSKYQLTPFWSNGAYRDLEYIREDFNDPEQVALWLAEGYANNFTGDMCDMRSAQPCWNHRFIRQFERFGWQDIGTSYYRMMPGSILPTHSDLYKRYVELFNLQGQEHTIRRAIVLLENWQPGHLLECCGDVITGWRAGTVIEWAYDTPHMAGNSGTTPRYTLQITGHL